MKERTILVVIPVREEHRELLEEAAPGNRFVYSSIKEVSREQVQEADIILGNVPADKIGASKKLEWLQLNSAGADAYAGEGILDKNTVVTTSNGAYGKQYQSICLPCCWPCRRNCISIVTARTSTSGTNTEL